MTYVQKYNQTLSAYNNAIKHFCNREVTGPTIKALCRLNLDDGLCFYWLASFDQPFPIEVDGYIYQHTPNECRDPDELKQSLQARIDFLIANKDVFINLDKNQDDFDSQFIDPNQLTLPF